MYIEQVRKSSNPFWKYILGIFILGIVVVLGNLPFEFAIINEVGVASVTELSTAEMLRILSTNKTLFLLLFPFALLFGAILLITKVFHKLSLRELITSRKKVDWKRIGFGFGSIVFMSAIMLLISYATNPEELQWNYNPKDFAILFVISILMVPLQTSAEELFFRGYLMQGLGRIFSKRVFPFVIPAILFGLMHFANPEVDKLGEMILISYLATGFFLGAITLLDEGLELALGFHAGNNLFLSLFLTSDWTAFQTNSLFIDVAEPKVEVYIIAPLVIYTLLFLVYARKYKWKNYMAQLFG